jgi:hypothetical protein
VSASASLNFHLASDHWLKGYFFGLYNLKSTEILSLFCRYAFQCPEAWNLEGKYRSLCYMRPLAIWAMQWALMQPKLPKQEPKPEMKEDSFLKEHAGFKRVARLLKLAEENQSRSLVQIIFDYTCKRMFN